MRGAVGCGLAARRRRDILDSGAALVLLSGELFSPSILGAAAGGGRRVAERECVGAGTRRPDRHARAAPPAPRRSGDPVVVR